MKREILLKLLKDKKLAATIGITGEYYINNTDTGKTVFKGHHEHFLRELGVRFVLDYRM
jgi:hypothetical protein